MFVPAQIPVSTTPVRLTPAGPGSRDGSAIAIEAPAGADLWLGPEGVTPSTGWPLRAGMREAYDLEYGEALFGVLASGSGVAYALRTGV